MGSSKNWLAAAAFLGALLSFGTNATAQTLACEVNSPRCWFIVFGTGDAPNRDVFLTDFKTRSKGDGVVQTDALQLWESPSQPSYALYTFSFRCAKDEMKVDKVLTASHTGKLETSTQENGWVKVPRDMWFERVHALTCNQTVRRAPEANAMFLGSTLVRPSDVASQLRKALWPTP